MARTAPVPNIPAIPGMNPGIFVLGGGGDGGGSGEGGGSGDKNKQGANGKNGGKDANGGGKGAGACGKGTGAPSCTNPSHGGGGGTTAGDPVDVLTGRVLTTPSVDLGLPGPFPLVLERSYSSSSRERDVGLGFGWTHSYAWSITPRRRTITIEQDSGTTLIAPYPSLGESVPLFGGLSLRVANAGFALQRSDGTTLLFHLDDAWDDTLRLSSIVDRNGNVIRLHYEGELLAGLTDAVGRSVRVVRHSSGRIAGFEVKTSTSSNGYRAFYRYEYDDAGDLVAVVDAAGYSTRFAYEDHRMVRQELPDGLVVRYRYDDVGRCVETWGERHGEDPSLASDVPEVLADGKTRARGVFHAKLLYDDGYSEVIDSTQVKRFFGNANGQVEKAVWGSGVSTHSFDWLGNWTTFTDPAGATTRVDRDPSGRLRTIVDPLGRTTEIVRDALGDPTELRRPDGTSLHFTRDAHGNLLGVRDAKGPVIDYEVLPNGLVKRAVLPNGGVTLFEQDAHGNITAITEPNGGTRRIAYDDLGRATQVVEADGGAASFTYDARGLLVAVRDAAGGVTSFEHDARRRVLRSVDAAGRVERREYGGLNALCAVHRPDGTTHRYLYDREGRFVALVDEAGRQHRFVRNAAGHVVREETLDGRVHRFVRDPGGRLLATMTEGGGTVEMEYDAAGQLVRRSFDDGTSEQFEYDLIGRLIRAATADVEVQRIFDERGCLLREIQQHGEHRYEVTSAHDAMGRVIERKSSLGFAEQVTRDAMGDASRIAWSGGHVDITRDVFGREQAVTLPGGGRISYGYDALGRLTRRTVHSMSPGALSPGQPALVGSVAANVSIDTTHKFSPASLVEEIHDLQVGVTRYEHDAIGQLLRRTPARGAGEAFHFDATGSPAPQSGPRRVHGPGGRVEKQGNNELVYDAEGRLVEKRLPDGSRIKYEWNGRGLLDRVVDARGGTTSFVYDSFARRLEKRSFGPDRALDVTRFVWDGDRLLHEIHERAAESGDPVVETRTYCFVDGHPLALGEIGPDAAMRFHVHGLDGFPDALVTGDGQVVGRQSHDAFGKLEGEPITAVRFAGQLADPETGLYYNRYRYYDPETGAYISPDPLEVSRSTRLYTYANGSPLHVADPDGLQPMTTTMTGTNGQPLGGGANGTPGLSQGGRDPNNPVALHPTVWNNMAESREVSPGNWQYPQATRHPANCSEPHAISNHLYDYEQRNGLPPGTCGSANDPNNQHLHAALSEVGNVTSTQQGGGQRNACPNCGVLMQNLQNQANSGLQPGQTPVNLVGAVTPGIDPPSAAWGGAAGGNAKSATTGMNPNAPRNMRVQPPPGVTPRGGGKWL